MICEDCEGTGFELDSDDCVTCNGTGIAHRGPIENSCSYCRGRGKIPGSGTECTTCNGMGYMEDTCEE